MGIAGVKGLHGWEEIQILNPCDPCNPHLRFLLLLVAAKGRTGARHHDFGGSGRGGTREYLIRDVQVIQDGRIRPWEWVDLAGGWRRKGAAGRAMGFCVRSGAKGGVLIAQRCVFARWPSAHGGISMAQRCVFARWPGAKGGISIAQRCVFACWASLQGWYL